MAVDTPDGPGGIDAFGRLLRLIRRFWWVILLSALGGAAAAFAYVSSADSRYESVALVRGWRDPLSGRWVSEHEMQIRLESADMLRAALESLRPDTAAPNAEMTVSWVPGTELLKFTSIASSPELAHGLLANMLPLLFEATGADQNALDALRREQAQLVGTLQTLQTTLELVNAADIQATKGFTTPSWVPLRLPTVSGLLNDMNTIRYRLDALKLRLSGPDGSSITQTPTLPSAPLPSRAAAISVLAFFGIALVGIAVLIAASILAAVLKPHSSMAGGEPQP